MPLKVAIIGSGFSGLSAAAYAAQAGHEVHVFEKNEGPGGRARQFKTANGYTFDMGPSWYWMPDIIDNFFADFHSLRADYFPLIALNPQFEMIFAEHKLSVPQSMEELRHLLEELEPGAAQQFDKFMKASQYKYQVGMQEYVQKPCHSWMEFVSLRIASSALKLDLLTNFRSYVKRYFKHPALVALMEFPVIFLGASPKDIPALYSMMNYGGYALGTWYPKGGFYALVEAMVSVARQQGVHFHYQHEVTGFHIEQGSVKALVLGDELIPVDAVIASSDYAHTESLLPSALRNYSDAYWASRVFAPSCLIYYIGLKQRIPNLKHHTLFFEHSLDNHIDAIYADKRWPEKPLFYSCCASKTDADIAPEGHENLFLLMPLATGIDDAEDTRERYFQEMITRLEQHTGMQDLSAHITYKRSYCVQDFQDDYHAYQGNAYGLANTLTQTAVLKPSIRNKKIANLFYTGQLTVPGPGVPPAIISGKIVAQELQALKK